MAQISPWHSPPTRDARECGWLQNVWLLHSCLSPPCVARNGRHRHCLLLLLSARFPLGRSSCSACAGGFAVSKSSTSLPVTLSLGPSSFWQRSERSCPPVSHLLTPPPPRSSSWLLYRHVCIQESRAPCRGSRFFQISNVCSHLCGHRARTNIVDFVGGSV